EQIEGELFVSVERKTGSVPMMMRGGDITSGLGMFQGEDIDVEVPFWREYTGKETGWLLKRREIRVLPVKGKRCVKCGYIEFYVKEG
ncbi:MAG: hypothetical protein ACETVR_00460, partial [Candidatus Bathyarchaeia archaeon]